MNNLREKIKKAGQFLRNKTAIKEKNRLSLGLYVWIKKILLGVVLLNILWVFLMDKKNPDGSYTIVGHVLNYFGNNWGTITIVLIVAIFLFILFSRKSGGISEKKSKTDKDVAWWKKNFSIITGMTVIVVIVVVSWAMNKDNDSVLNQPVFNSPVRTIYTPETEVRTNRPAETSTTVLLEPSSVTEFQPGVKYYFDQFIGEKTYFQPESPGDSIHLRCEYINDAQFWWTRKTRLDLNNAITSVIPSQSISDEPYPQGIYCVVLLDSEPKLVKYIKTN